MILETGNTKGRNMVYFIIVQKLINEEKNFNIEGFCSRKMIEMYSNKRSQSKYDLP